MQTQVIGPLLLLLGLIGLWGGNLLTVRGAVLFSERHGLSKGFIGLTVLSIGTDLPELFISVGASLQQIAGVEASGIIVGTAIGSTMAQATLVVGVAGLFGYLSVAPSMIKRDGTTLLLAAAMAFLLGFDGNLDRIEGLAMLIAYALYLVALSQGERGRTRNKALAPGLFPTPVLILVGLGTVTLAAHVVSTEGVALAETWGMSQTLLGVFILGVGTSLPELALSPGAGTRVCSTGLFLVSQTGITAVGSVGSRFPLWWICSCSVSRVMNGDRPADAVATERFIKGGLVT